MAFPVLAACTPLDRRWISETGLDGRTPVAVLAVDSRPALPPSSLSLHDLPEQAAASYINALTKFTTNPAELAAALGKPVASGSAPTDLRSFSRVVNLNVSKRGYAPGDRIVQLRISILPENFAFTGWSAAETEYTVQDIDKITVTTAARGSAELKPTFSGKLVGTGGLTSSLEQTTENSANIMRRVEQLTVSVEGGRLVIFRESERGFDLTGNTVIRLTLRPKVQTPIGTNLTEVAQTTVTDLNIGNASAWKGPSHSTITLQTVRGLTPTNLTGVARIDYVIRHVLAGSDTYRESDDIVRFETSCLQQNVVLVSADESGLQSWGIQTGTDRLAIQADEGVRDLVFQDRDVAARFAAWINHTRASSVGGRTLGILDRSKIAAGLQPLKSARNPFFVVSRSDVVEDSNAAFGNPQSCTKTNW